MSALPLSPRRGFEARRSKRLRRLVHEYASFIGGGFKGTAGKVGAVGASAEPLVKQQLGGSFVTRHRDTRSGDHCDMHRALPPLHHTHSQHDAAQCAAGEAVPC